MDNYDIEKIKEDMDGIHEEDLQRRLKKYYEDREKLIFKLQKTNTKLEIKEKLEELINDIELHIKVYEKELPLRAVERAKRSAGLYRNAEDIEKSIKREEKDNKMHEDSLRGE